MVDTESEPQGTLMGLRVKDGGKSESPLVMRGIGVQTLPHPQGALTSYPGVSSRESWINHLKVGKQMTADFGLAGAPADGDVGWRQAGIVKRKLA